jgi:hypothetical protein
MRVMKLISETVVLVDILMEMPPLTSRKSGDDGGVDFPFTGGTGAIE